MHFHLPKPIHGWRAFFGEVGIIVVGVLIALALESIADELRWRRKVSEARQVIRYEVGHNVRLYDLRTHQQPCVERRLDELAMILQRADTTGRLPPLGAINGPAGGTWPEGVWESQNSAETATHFPAIELASLARVYRFIDLTRESRLKEADAWAALQTMVGPGRAIDASERSRLLTALIVARKINKTYALSAGTIRQILSQSGLGTDFPQIDPRNPPVLNIDRQLICQPIGTRIPMAYGMDAGG